MRLFTFMQMASSLHTLAFILLFIQAHNHAQAVENFSCVFSGCAGEDIVCNCSVADDPLFWWDGNSGFCSITILHDSNPTRDEANVVAEVVARSPSGGFTSKLTRRNISTELNGTEIGCSQSQIDSVICRPSSTDRNSSFTLIVQSCQAPNPPRDLSLVTAQDAQCNSTMRTVTLTWMAPQPRPSRLPVTHYNFTCTSGEGNSCSETLPADTTSYDLTVVAGVQYTITVSALSNGRESQGNPQLKFTTIKVLNWITADSNATIQLRSGNFTSNFTINYKPCSGDPSKIQFRPPVVHLVNLTADVMYCYSIASNENSDATQVAGSCNGTFYTTADTTTETPPTTDKLNNATVSGVMNGLIFGAVLMFIIVIGILQKERVVEEA